MLIHDDIYSWEGFGGKLRLGSGSCRLRIYDLKKGYTRGLAHLRPFIVVVSDIPGGRMSIKSCAGHIATYVTKEFNIKPHRMLWVEYYPEKKYGKENVRTIPERFEGVEFVWHEDKAIHPRAKPLNSTMLKLVKELMGESQESEIANS